MTLTDLFRGSVRDHLASATLDLATRHMFIVSGIALACFEVFTQTKALEQGQTLCRQTLRRCASLQWTSMT